MTFNNYINTTSEIIPFELSSYQSIVDAYAEGVGYQDVRHGYISGKFFPANIVKGIYSDIKELELMVVHLMKGESKWVLPEYDEEGNETVALEYNTIPTTLDELKAQSITLTIRDFDSKVKGVYSTMTAEDFQDAVEYAIDKIITYSDGSGSNTWSKFITYFAE